MPDRTFRNQQAVFADLLIKAAIIGRIDIIDAAAEHGDRATFQRHFMRAGIDATRQSGNNLKAGLAQFVSKGLGDLLAGGGGIARADNADGPLARFQRAQSPQNRGRCVDLFQQGGIIAVAQNGQACAGAFGTGQFFIEFGDRIGCQRPARPLDDVRQFFQRPRSGTETLHQLGEIDRSDALGARQSQPGDAFRLIGCGGDTVKSHGCNPPIVA